eukprot:COSAG02_NODE_35512_length_467_cov_0.725543_1_plen_50_part_10
MWQDNFTNPAAASTKGGSPCKANPGCDFFKQKTAYEFSECDWSSDVCSSD